MGPNVTMFSFLLSIPKRILVFLVRVYQLVLSPHLGASCRFTPTCSEYAIQALEKYGAAKGFILATHRIMRCNPWGGHGEDPPRWYGEQDPESDHDSAEKVSEPNPLSTQSL